MEDTKIINCFRAVLLDIKRLKIDRDKIAASETDTIAGYTTYERLRFAVDCFLKSVADDLDPITNGGTND